MPRVEFLARDKQFGLDLVALGRAYSADIVPLSLLVRVLLSPLLRMAVAENLAVVETGLSETLSLQQDFRCELFVTWVLAFQRVLVGEVGPAPSLLSMPVLTPGKHNKLVGSLFKQGIIQNLANLIACPSPSPRVAICVLDTMQHFLSIPHEPGTSPVKSPAVYDARLCKKVLKDKAVMEKLLLFALRNIAAKPKADIEWVGVRCVDLIAPLLAAGPGCLWQFCDPANPALYGRVDYCYTEATPIEDGTHKFTVYFDLKLNLDLMYSYLHNGKLYDASEFIAAKERISDMNSLGSSGTSGQEEAGTSFKYFKPQFGNRTVSQLKCSGCGVSGRGQKLMACKGCEKAWYCGRECQLADWKSHKIECKKAGQRS